MSPLYVFQRKPINYDRCAVISGLGVSPTSRCIFVRVRRKIQCLLFLLRCRALFSPELFPLLRLSLFHQRIGAMRLSLRRFGRRCQSLLTLRRDALNIITTNILNEVGAVSAQSWRQSYENILLLYNRRFWGFGKEIRNSLQSVHYGSPLCINSTADFYSYRKEVGAIFGVCDRLGNRNARSAFLKNPHNNMLNWIISMERKVWVQYQ